MAGGLDLDISRQGALRNRKAHRHDVRNGPAIGRGKMPELVASTGTCVRGLTTRDGPPRDDCQSRRYGTAWLGSATQELALDQTSAGRPACFETAIAINPMNTDAQPRQPGGEWMNCCGA